MANHTCPPTTGASATSPHGMRSRSSRTEPSMEGNVTQKKPSTVIGA
ncbi:hypothetical protein [Planobispora longispora]|nr:hypothetical protein [Planobispora longispora]